MYPIRFEPIYQDYIWGGYRIAQKFNRQKRVSRIAESWEISDREEGISVVINGSYQGKTLHDLVDELGEDLLGKGRKFDRFPLLLKIIDAQENLSIQVHPDETNALLLNGEPKTEMWISLDEATVYAGFKEDMTAEKFSQASALKQAETLLEKFDLKPKEAVYIPGGRVHCICAGSLIYEIQQNSNTTYRLYDWDRVGRDLHLKEGARATHWNKQGDARSVPQSLVKDADHEKLHYLNSPFFTVDRLDIFTKLQVAPSIYSFQIFFCMEGEGEISVDSHSETFQVGTTYLVPAAARSILIEGKCQILRVRLPYTKRNKNHSHIAPFINW